MTLVTSLRSRHLFLCGFVDYSTLSYLRSSCSEVFLKISQNSQENTCASVSFFIKLQAWGLEFLTLSCLMSKNGQTHFKNLAAFAARFLKCVWPFWGISHKRVKNTSVGCFCYLSAANYFITWRQTIAITNNFGRGISPRIATK